MVELHLIPGMAIRRLQNAGLRPKQINFLIDGDSDQRLLNVTYDATVHDLRGDRLIVADVILIPHVTANGERHGQHAGTEQSTRVRTEIVPGGIGQDTGEMAHAHNENMANAEAAVAILHAHLPEEAVLLIRRADREGDPWSGHWSFPGGRHDVEDSNLLVTALRELEEECGIQLEQEDLEAALRPTLAGRRSGKFVLVAPFLFKLQQAMPTVLDTREAVEAVWMPLSRMRDLAEHRLRNVPGVPEEMHFPAIELQGTPLWGFTYRVLCEWLGLTPGPGEMVKAGLDTAQRVLDFLLSEGLTLEHSWTERGAARVATVRGRIPQSEVLAQFAPPRRGVPPVNFLEVQAGHIHLSGPAFDEYFIYSVD